MLTYPHIDPIIVSFGRIGIHWYGMMYVIGLALGWWIGRVRARRPDSGWTPAEVDDLVFYVGLGVVIGGRLGYMLFYEPFLPAAQQSHFWEVWKGGMSFHGGLLGVLIAMWLFGRKYHKRFFTITDFIAPLVPLGLGPGRLGNFINGELWGKVSDLPWAMRLPCNDPRFTDLYCHGATTGYSRPHLPTQLYEFVLEGVVLFIILWFYSSRPRPTMAVSGLFLIGYGAFRFAVEFVRLPDKPLGYLAFGWVTMGQVLSVPMILAGIGLMWWAYARRRRNRDTSRQAGV
ncbi:MAG TPA: prolipoprotein diacylglyceryl transferase [Gammaproteobacteria bacterium]|nr:prolipoprotein diacylglyceryl transferase [Gammaproteobacteria bacterium]